MAKKAGNTLLQGAIDTYSDLDKWLLSPLLGGFNELGNGVQLLGEEVMGPGLNYKAGFELLVAEVVAAAVVAKYAKVVPKIANETTILSDKALKPGFEVLNEELAAARAAKSASTKTGNELSTIRYTQEGEVYVRYESSSQIHTKITPTGGVKTSTYAAPISDGIVPVADRVTVYNLPTPEILRTEIKIITPPPGTPIIGPRSVQGGTGNEVIFPVGSP